MKLTQKYRLITASWFIGFIHDNVKAIQVLNDLFKHLEKDGNIIMKESTAGTLSEQGDGTFGYYQRTIEQIESIISQSTFKHNFSREGSIEIEGSTPEHYWIITRKDV